MHGLRLRSNQVSQILRLFGEIRDIGERARARAHALDSLCRIVEADAVLLTRRIAPGAGAESVVEARALGRGPACDVSALGRLADPARARLAGETGGTVARRREELIGDEAWYASGFVCDARRPLGLDHTIYAMSRGRGRTTAHVLEVMRAWGRRAFEPEDRDLVHLFHTECVPWIWRTTGAEDADASLSPRERQTLEALLTGASEKQIAARLGVATSTVHGYVKAVYRRFGVHSRAELMARWMRTPGGGPSERLSA
jgi:DNA-binding CsgD family transcriptional regulator